MYNTIKHQLLTAALLGATALTMQAQTLKVAGTAVAETTASITAENEGCFIFGTVSYDADTKTLTLDDAIINTNLNGIECDDDLNIVLKGDNKIVVDSHSANTFALVLTGGNVTISSEDGKGNLTIIGSDMEENDTDNADLAYFQTMQLGEATNLTIDHAAFITYEGVHPASQKFFSPSRYCGHLKVKNADFETRTDLDEKARNTQGWPTVCYFASVTLENSNLVVPADGRYDTTVGQFMSEELGYEGYYYGVVKIVHEGGDTPGPEPTEAVYIAGLKVTATTDEVVPTAEGSEIAAGKVSYDAATKTLTLDNATIKCYIPNEYSDNNMENGIENEVDGLTINLIGENQIVYGWGKGFVTKANVTLTSADGNGSLFISPDDNNNLTYPDALVVDESATLTVSNAVLSIDTPVNMLGDDEYGMGGSLVIDNATMEITKGRITGYLQNVTSLTLNGTTVYDADDNELTFDPDKHMVVNESGARYKGAITIKPTIGDAVGIDELSAASADEAFYNLSGQRVKNAVKGVFIANGKKFVVK